MTVAAFRSFRLQAPGFAGFWLLVFWRILASGFWSGFWPQRGARCIAFGGVGAPGAGCAGVRHRFQVPVFWLPGFCRTFGQNQKPEILVFWR
jgi:hypothetical protein